MATEPASRINEVHLVGRLAAAVVDRQLPSGDTLATFRLVVDRPRGAPGPRVDTVDCAAWRGDVRRTIAHWSPGDVVRVEGELRRRFWRAGAAAVSRYEVEVGRARRLARAS
jgi:single-strand DNA-binding protein